MKLLPKMSGAAIARAGLSCSLALVTCLAAAGTYSDLQARLDAASPEQQRSILKSAASSDTELAKAIDLDSEMSQALDYVRIKAFLETPNRTVATNLDVKSIKASPLYHDDGRKVSQNWLANAAERLQRLFHHESPDTPRLNIPQVGAPGWLVPFAWFVLGAALVGFIAYALRFVSLSKLKKRQARAMLEDDEPERTLDEWLALADQFEREGKYRDAVRALYLSCLLKFDERNIARFVRGQTNWEHLARIESSPKKPAGLDFREPTKTFDRVWYGYKVRGQEDIVEFRSWYRSISDLLKGVAA